jgi:hypothetical protein
VHERDPATLRFFGNQLQTELAAVDIARARQDPVKWQTVLKKLLYLLLARRRISGETIPLLHQVPRPGPDNTRDKPERCAVLFL